MAADEQEPRFAGSAPAGYQPRAAEPLWATVAPAPPPTSAPPVAAPEHPFPPPLEPEVSYADGESPPEAEAGWLAQQAWLAPLLAAFGGGVAIVASVLNWATLRLVSKTLSVNPDPQDSERIAYNGLNLLEGRVTLVAGVIAVVFSVLLALRRSHVTGLRPPVALLASGGVGLLAGLFSAIAHPVDLSALSRVFGSADEVTVRVPNGPGVWLALIGSVLILAGGLAALASPAHETVE